MEACIQKHTRESLFFSRDSSLGLLGDKNEQYPFFCGSPLAFANLSFFHTLSSFQIYWSRKAIRETFWQKEKKKTKKKKKLLCCRVSAVVTAVIMKYEKYAQEQGVAKWTRQKRAILDLSHFREEKKSIIDHMHKDSLSREGLFNTSFTERFWTCRARGQWQPSLRHRTGAVLTPVLSISIRQIHVFLTGQRKDWIVKFLAAGCFCLGIIGGVECRIVSFIKIQNRSLVWLVDRWFVRTTLYSGHRTHGDALNERLTHTRVDDRPPAHFETKKKSQFD